MVMLIILAQESYQFHFKKIFLNDRKLQLHNNKFASPISLMFLFCTGYIVSAFIY